MSLRIGGFAAILGAALWALAGLLSLGLIADSSEVGPALLMTGMIVLLIALAGLSAFQAHAHPVAIGLAFAVTGIGTLVTFLGYLLGVWNLWILGILAVMLGSGLFALVTFRTRALPRVGPILMGIGIGTVFVNPIMAFGISAFALGWFVLGIQSLRLVRPALGVPTG